MADTKKYQVGVIGYGLSAKIFQIPYILAAPEFELRAVVQRSGDDAAKAHPGCVVYRSADELFGDSAVDVVVVSTPPPSHFGLVSGALNAGKHVVVEKPFCPSSKECNDLIALAEKKQRLLTVFQNRRWDVDYHTLQKILDSGTLGRIVEFETHYDRFDPQLPPSNAASDAPPGSGVLYDLGSHLIDQVLHSFGLPASITGVASVQRAPGAKTPPDACTLLLHYDSGLLVTVKASAMSAEAEQLRFWVRGEKGNYKKYHIDPQEPQLIAGIKIDDPAFGVEDEKYAGTLTTLSSDGFSAAPYANLPSPTYGAFYKNLAIALGGQGAVPVPTKDARNVIRVIELAIESSEKGVTIMLDAADFS